MNYLLFKLFIVSKILIYNAGSLSVPLAQIDSLFKFKTGIKVENEQGGSRFLIKKVKDLQGTPDIIMVADYRLLKELIPTYADSFSILASNSMVIAYNGKSKESDKINVHNWYKILSKNGIIIGRSDPNLDPCGYRALFVLQLASLYYNDSSIYTDIMKNSPRKYTRPKSVSLISLLESGEMDYIFEYKSVAVQHKLKFISLPDSLNLNSPENADFYKRARFVFSNGDTITGSPILYGISILKKSKGDLEVQKYIKFLKETGPYIFKQNGQIFLLQ